MAARRILTLSLVGVAAAAVAVACFDDLPAAEKCPPPSPSLDSCNVQKLEAAAMTATTTGQGCLGLDFLSCMLGVSADACKCSTDSCPQTTGADCFPHDECPSAITTAGARCPKLDTPNLGCECGCASCVAVCDGYGPALGVALPDAGAGTVQPIATLKLTSLPSSGHVGAYARVRGVGVVSLVIFDGRGAQGSDSDPLANIQTGDGAYHDLLVKPAIDTSMLSGDVNVALIVQTGTVSVVQVDCIVPVYTP